MQVHVAVGVLVEVVVCVLVGALAVVIVLVAVGVFGERWFGRYLGLGQRQGQNK